MRGLALLRLSPVPKAAASLLTSRTSEWQPASTGMRIPAGRPRLGLLQNAPEDAHGGRHENFDSRENGLVYNERLDDGLSISCIVATRQVFHTYGHIVFMTYLSSVLPLYSVSAELMPPPSEIIMLLSPYYSLIQLSFSVSKCSFSFDILFPKF